MGKTLINTLDNLRIEVEKDLEFSNKFYFGDIKIEKLGETIEIPERKIIKLKPHLFNPLNFKRYLIPATQGREILETYLVSDLPFGIERVRTFVNHINYTLQNSYNRGIKPESLTRLITPVVHHYSRLKKQILIT